MIAELTEFESKLLDAWRSYDAECDSHAQREKLDELIEVVADRVNDDGWDSVWYARRVDRVQKEAFYSNFRAADDCTFYGLAKLISSWAENTNPPAVRVENE